LQDAAVDATVDARPDDESKTTDGGERPGWTSPCKEAHMRAGIFLPVLCVALVASANDCVAQDVSLLERSCNSGTAESCFNLGKMYRYGDGVTQDLARAALLYEQACEGDYAEGCFNLGVMYVFGDGVTGDLARAASLYEKACNGNYAMACFNLALAHAIGDGITQDVARAALLYEKACDGNYAEGCFSLGVAYADGAGVTQDLDRAALLYEKACDGDHAMGCFNLGKMYRHGDGVIQDFVQAASLYEKACDGGYAESCSNLGVMYTHGLGVPQDDARAASYHQSACDGEYVVGCYFLGLMYETGVGVTQDHTRAASLYERACNGGLTNVCLDMTPTVVLETTMGRIVMELDRERAPMTVGNFITHLNQGFYDGLIFHRIMPNFVIQAGLLTADYVPRTSPAPFLQNEGDNGLKNLRGTIAMARGTDPHTAKVEFFINVKDNPQLDTDEEEWGWGVFGKVIEGLDVVDRIREVPTMSLGTREDVPAEAVVIERCYVTTEPDSTLAGVSLSTVLPTLADLPEGPAVASEGPLETLGLDGYGRDFEATSLVFRLGSSQVLWMSTAVELYSDAASARAPVSVLSGMRPEAMVELFALGIAEGAGFDPENVDAEEVTLPPIGDAASAWLLRFEGAGFDLDFYKVLFVRGQVVARVMIGGGHDRIMPEDVVDMAQLIDRRIQGHEPTMIARESGADLAASTQARRLLARADSLARQGSIPEAIASYSEAQALDSTITVSASSWNNLCWYGSLWGHVAEVMAACEQTVAMTPESHESYGGRRDSRGLARALTGDYEGAIGDFEAFVALTSDEEDRAQRQCWIATLRDGENPFTLELLETLREPVSEAEAAARSEGFDLAAMVLRLDDLPAGVTVTTDGYSDEPEETSGYEREFEASALLIELGSSRAFLISSAVELYSSVAAAIRAIVVFEQDEISSCISEFLPEEGVDTVAVERLDAPEMGSASEAWRVRIETAVIDFDMYLLVFAQGRLAGAVVTGGPSGQLALQDLTPLVQLMHLRVESQAPSALEESVVARLVEVLKEAESLVREGKIPDAMTAYAEAQELDSTIAFSPSVWNNLCWYGSLWGHASNVITRCEQAVELAPSNGAYRDSRGLARALTGDLDGAIVDFEAFVAWTSDDESREQRRDWINALRVGESPFTSDVLESLR
jgi:TPR repeat protein